MTDLGTITTQLRHGYKHNPTQRDKALLVMVLVLIAVMAAL